MIPTRILKMAANTLKVGYVPEHFFYSALSLPGITVSTLRITSKFEFLPFPSGSGHLIQSLQDKSIGKELGYMSDKNLYIDI